MNIDEKSDKVMRNDFGLLIISRTAARIVKTDSSVKSTLVHTADHLKSVTDKRTDCILKFSMELS